LCATADPDLPASDNHLIDLLPRPLALRLHTLAERVELPRLQVLFEARRPLRHVYFPIDAYVSLLTPMDGGHPDLEVGLVGREGMLGAHLLLGVARAPLRARVQGAGLALRIATAAFRAALADSVALRQVLQRYLSVQMAQLALSAGCQRHHLIGPRLARWLLMSQDRAHAVHFHVTHETLAGLLGVRRVGITVAATALQRLGLIGYRRGEMTVLDRAGLEDAACACYAADRQAYAERMS
jgi:CRP-like cAMP-binding protein